MLRRSDRRRLRLQMHAQPDDFTCGPTCLHAVYRWWGHERALHQVITETGRLEEGGTLAVFLGQHALRSGFKATIYTFNVRLFDPSWFPRGGGQADPVLLADRLKRQAVRKTARKMRIATGAYLDYLELGGMVCMEDLTGALLRRHLRAGVPILAGLSATYLYSGPREIEISPDRLEEDDIGGDPTGHFVVLEGWSIRRREVTVVDPHAPGSRGEARRYGVGINRLVCAILIGVLTYDGNLLVLEPRADSDGRHERDRGKEGNHVDPGRGG